MEKIRRVKFDIDKNNPLSGVKTMSLVSDPAIESDFKFFSKQDNPKKYIELKATNYKQVVAGLALIPDKDIKRFDVEGNEYFGYFTSDSIEAIRNQFHKQEMTSRVNVEHDQQDYIDAYLIESYIVDSPEMLKAVQAKGIEDVVLGSWYVAYKIESPEVFAKAVSGELKGFSVEIFLAKFTKAIQENNLNKSEKSIMTKFFEKLKSLVSEMEKDESPQIKLADDPAPVEDKPADAPKEDAKSGSTTTAANVRNQSLTYGEIGQPVTVTSYQDADYKVQESATTYPAPSGDYQLDNGQSITVDASSNLLSLAPTPKSELQSKAEPAKVEPAKVEAPKENFSAVNESLNTEIQNLRVQLERLSKVPVTTPMQKNETKEDMAKRTPPKPLSEMTAAEKMRFKHNF